MPDCAPPAVRTRFDASLLAAVAAALLAPPGAAQDWPAFRGPHGDGSAAPGAIPLRWDRSTHVRWRTALPRPANGSPIVSGGRVFVTGAEDRDGRRRSLYCFDRRTGARLWTRTVGIDKTMPTHQTNPYGGTTPAADGTHVVVWHASAGLWCYRFDGAELWHRDLGEFRHRWGYGTSPVLHRGRVLLHTGPGRKVFVAAFALDSGKTVWQTDEPVAGDGQDNDAKRLMGSWCTPLIVRVAGAEQILCTMSTRLVAYRPEDGRVLWSCGGLPCARGDLAYSSPSVADGVCVVVGGYEGPILGVKLDAARGDVTATHRLWRHENQPSNCGSGVFAGGDFYIPDMRGTLACFDPKTGKLHWRARPAKGAIWSSIVQAADHLLVTNQNGTTVVFKPNRGKLDVVAQNALEEPTNSTPAIAGGEVFLRTHRALYCISTTIPPQRVVR
ncbi:MAG: PQQ-binding-like beta-propeller repeat protein [Planctomycetes bacterium]|nr:PQQ-binding-like beta-propeller repeat protein [Planctomycetota bacterium]